MKSAWRLGLFLLAFLFLCHLRGEANAATPPKPKELSERVGFATHVFVGQAKNLQVLDSSGKPVQPYPQDLERGQEVEMTVDVVEVLSPVKWAPSQSISVRFGGGSFRIEDLKKQFLGKRWIYLTRMTGGQGPAAYFVPSYGWNLVEDMGQKAAILKILKPAKPANAPKKKKGKKRPPQSTK